MPGKKMPPEVANQLDQVERILAHLDDGYELPDEDKPYFDKVNMVFKIIHGEEDQERARKKIAKVLGKGNHTKLIDDVTRVYGDFFTINSAAMRIIQEKRHERLYEAAMRNKDYPAAERALRAIDQLYRLYNKADDLPISNRRLPKTKLVSDPEALNQLKVRRDGTGGD